MTAFTQSSTYKVWKKNCPALLLDFVHFFVIYVLSIKKSVILHVGFSAS